MRQINEINNKNLFLYQIFYFKITFVNSQLENTNSKGDFVLNTTHLKIENYRIFYLFIVLCNLKMSCHFYGKRDVILKNAVYIVSKRRSLSWQF